MTANGDILTHDADGMWETTFEPNSRSTHTGGTKAEEQAVGRNMSREDAVEQTITKLNGKIGEIKSYRNDTHPRRG